MKKSLAGLVTVNRDEPASDFTTNLERIWKGRAIA